MTVLPAQTLESYARELLTAGGFAPAHAENTARVLVWANARGTDSHGVLRIPRYIDMIDEGKIDPVAVPEVERSEGAVSILEAARAPGASAMIAAMAEAIASAGRQGIGWCSARNITHAGAVGYYALEAARQGCLGIIMTASGPLMAYHGARVSGLSTNPISIAVPADPHPILLDMSTSTVALGKIMHARDAGKAIPEGWAIDKDGGAATDPNNVETLTPMSGPKGSGLSLMIEVLASVLVGNPVISEALSGRPASMNGVALAIDLRAFGDTQRFARDIAALVATLKGLPKARGVEEILMPGERGFAMSEARLRDGIPLAAGTVKRLGALAGRLGVVPPSEVAGGA
ncbi:Ldh family oxidoreductase [Frigidibacter sp. ROC022]|uniref:Ldh family oxidoreductase n=1 Tax=Frigidibacter sp. ROC022 TaxID=2971796 RepID=UPI00215A96AC|nr:Ldh family oxidoreductase [Frigidibacter sp. ROC022]MCR8724653.1 Ldh family oxidoreductase [Frigidibacter sp. ROC022]